MLLRIFNLHDLCVISEILSFSSRRDIFAKLRRPNWIFIIFYKTRQLHCRDNFNNIEINKNLYFNYYFSRSIEGLIFDFIIASYYSNKKKLCYWRSCHCQSYPAAASVAIANCSSRLILECPVGINAEVRYFIVLLILRVAVQRIIIIEDGTLHNVVACASRERARAFFFCKFIAFSV